MTDFIYITSASFSGSTLLTFLLNTHAKIATIGEMKGSSMDVQAYRCSCGQNIGRCDFWQRLVAGMRRRGIPFDLADVWTQCGYRVPDAPLANRVVRHRQRAWLLERARDAFIALSPACRRAIARIDRTNVAFVELVTQLQGRPVFLDSSKDATRLRFLQRIPEFRLKVVYLVRDGRGVMNSTMKRHGMDAETAAREWVMAQQEVQHALRYFSQGQVLRLRYEDLCRDPQATLRRTVGFAGLDPEEMCGDYRSVEHHILGNDMRFNDSAEIVLDTRWTRELSPESLATFERIGAALNRRFGYDDSPYYLGAPCAIGAPS